MEEKKRKIIIVIETKARAALVFEVNLELDGVASAVETSVTYQFL